MISLRKLALVSLMLILPACAGLDALPPSEEAEHAPSSTQLGQTLATTESGKPEKTTDESTSESVPAASEEAAQETIPADETAAPTDLPVTGSSSPPGPTLFDNPWADLGVFQAGLLDGEQAVVHDLKGASIYHMNLAIEEPTAVSGQMEVLYTNQEDVALDEIYFHLFANQLGGSIAVSEASVNGHDVQPEYDGSALRVPLETALNPGQSAVVTMEFVTKLPSEDESTKYNILAYNEDILALAHFYPMIATYDESGWHIETSPPHGDETYADMSHFLMRLTAPAEQVVVTSGIELDRSETGAAQTLTFAAGPVRDFYLAMSDRFGVVSDQVGLVQINSYAPAELLDGAEWALDVGSHALRSFNERYGPYPYKELDIVSTPTQALGIEYPGIFANALRIYDVEGESSSGSPNAILLESVTAHEAAHQWFYNLVGNDQLNEPWLDEATTQYATWMYYVDRYGEEVGEMYYETLEGRWARTDFADIPIGMPAEDYDGQEYGAIVYGRGPIFLGELAQKMGQEAFDAFLYDYAQSFRWQIATSEDFQSLAEEHCQCDLSSLFDAAVYAN